MRILTFILLLATQIAINAGLACEPPSLASVERSDRGEGRGGGGGGGG